MLCSPAFHFHRGGRASVLAAMENFDRGSRESLRKNASYNAGAIVTFCGELNWR